MLLVIPDPVIVQYDPASRTGNRMFMYAFGLTLALRRGSSFFHDAIPEMNIPCKSWSKAANIAPIKGEYLCTRWMGDHHVDPGIWSYQGPIIVNSFLQKKSYFIEHQQFLRNRFTMVPGTSINGDKLIAHYRGTDYHSIGCHLDYSTYRKSIDASGFSNVTIVTDDPKAETVQKLIADGCQLSADTAKGDLNLLLNSENILISHSSYSWWAAFLGNHKKVIIPFMHNRKTMWPINPGKDDIDLVLDMPEWVKYVW